MDQAGSYIRLLALFAAALALILAAFNFIVDPYGYFDGPRIAGVNELTLGFNHRPLLGKSLAVSRIRPASIILGNSRAESAYDPEHPGFAERPAYNLAVGGAGLGQVRRYFFEALATGRLRQVLLATDLTMFEPSLEAQQRIPDLVMLTDEPGKLAGSGRKWRRLAFILLSGTTSSDSWWSLRHQRDPVAIYRRSGVREESYDEAQVERQGGHRSASLDTESVFFATALRDVSSPGFREGYETILAQFREIVAVSAQHGIRLDIVINPIHARYSYLYAAAGLWPVYEKWKRDLVAVAARSPRPVALWDFSGVSKCTAEPMPPAGDATTKMRWYRESGHFRPRLGKLVLDRVYGGGGEGPCPGLGRRLEAATLEGTLAGQRIALKRWVASHPSDVAEINALAKRYRRGPSPVLLGLASTSSSPAIRSSENSRAIATPADAHCSRNPRSLSARMTALARAAGSPTGTTAPAPREATQWAIPAPSLVTLGVPTAAASTVTILRPSPKLGLTLTSAAAKCS